MTSLINDNIGAASRLTNLIIQPWLWIMHVKLFKLESSFFTFFRYCGQTAPKFENTVFDLGRARWLIIFNNTLHKERGKIIFNENIKLWLYNSVKKVTNFYNSCFGLTQFSKSYNTKKISCKLKFSNPYIFATLWLFTFNTSSIDFVIWNI